MEGEKNIFFPFFAFFWNFLKKISNFLKKYEKNSTTYTGHMEPKIILFSIFPQTKMVFLRGKIAKNQLHLAKFGCVSGAISIFRKPGLWQIGVVTKYRWLNATKWPQMPQKLIRTISHGSGHPLDTLNHGLGPLFYCFITLFCVKGSLDPPWHILAAPWTPWRPPDPWYVILGQIQSSWVIMSHIWPI